MDNNSFGGKNKRIVFGVFSGIANRTGIPAGILRSIFMVIIILTYGGAALAYFIIGMFLVSKGGANANGGAATTRSASAQQLEARLLQQMGIKEQAAVAGDSERGRPQTYKPMPQDAHGHAHESAAHAFSCGGKFDAASYNEETFYREASRVRDDAYGQ